ncbi:hypothetical protein BU24DRAFT_468257 [Aaosphaeria arxii CBS 175.79]|uniref:Subtilisin-like protein n=1 Tax=Aaosphaeria arxii CBS 175.79 TaxID=1450172 RepID=A0A6A5X8K5_9PLEO|nr:uncharacterized protein BU24DRAFT_468257 [Aaosphaeria arxii CBS 175.79]KAF2009282.1 hypothetical protein BU24DRAFT_468257 [Aaosphaeria arxii CBS 175.79]
MLIPLSFGSALLVFVATSQALPSTIIPGRFLVEFEDHADHTLFSHHLKRDGLSAHRILTTESEIFRAASYKIDISTLGDDPLTVLSSIPAIKNIWPVEVVERPDDALAWKGSDLNTAPVSIKKQVGKVAVKGEGFTPHVLTQVDRVHGSNITGRGIKVGIVDDGIDYRHPALGRGFGQGYLVARGYDHIGDEYSPYRGNDPVPDEDPFTECDGHGTHVAGIIAAQGVEDGFKFRGAAPDVELGMYRVFSCAGSTTTDVVAAGINKAFADGNHIITASLGARSGWTESTLSVIADRIAAKGVILTFAQGNSGSTGPFFPESPGTGADVFAIGSTANSILPRVVINSTFTSENGTSKVFVWTSGSPQNWGNATLPLYVGDGKNCDEFTNAGNLTGYVVLVKGTNSCADWYKAEFAARKGAKYAFMYRDGSEATSILSFPDESGLEAIGSLPFSTAREWIQLSKSGKKVNVQITDPKYAVQFVDEVPNVGGGLMSGYSSWGPTFELDIKPEVSAPGGVILSTWPRSLGRYAVISGTSMATPLIAGIIALILQARPSITASEVRSLLTTTSKPLHYLNESGPNNDLAPVVQQGGGIAQAYDAVHSNGILSISKLILNDTEHFVQSHTFTIKNVGEKDITYSLSHEPAATFHTFRPKSKTPSLPGNLEFVPFIADASFSSNPGSLTVHAGSTGNITVTFTPPPSVNPALTPVYSGYIKLNASNNAVLSIPYLGVASRMRDISLFSNLHVTASTATNPTIVSPQGTEFTLPINPDGSWSDPGPNVTVRYSFPILYEASTSFGIPLLDLHVWSVNVTATSPPNASLPLVKDFGRLWGYPTAYIPRSAELYDQWNGTLSDGSRVPAGNYTFVAKALKIFGDIGVEEDYEVVRTIDFGVRYL